MKKLVVLLIGFVFVGCSSLKISKKDNTAIVALTASTTYIGGTGKGMIITLKNIETGEKYDAKKLSHFSSHCIVHDIKTGKYQVEKIIWKNMKLDGQAVNSKK